jgi:peptidoglycan L-alanyl-D-glutamate endopeptidase CwlK
METLEEGSDGADVTTLQTLLQQKGFPPGVIDGNFGPATEAALIGFQRSEGLTPNGIFDARTAQALGIPSENQPAPSAMPNVTVAVVAKMFPMTPIGHINANLPAVLVALVGANLTDVPIVLAALATIRAETEGFVPISEGESRFNTSPQGQPFDLYDNRKDLGNQGPPDGASFRGRGYVQLTGRTNYTKFGPIVGVNNLVAQPEQANDPTIAAKILAAFIASKATAIATALHENDLAAARRLVNGGSNGLDRFTAAYKMGASLLIPTA